MHKCDKFNGFCSQATSHKCRIRIKTSASIHTARNILWNEKKYFRSNSIYERPNLQLEKSKKFSKVLVKHGTTKTPRHFSLALSCIAKSISIKY